MNKPNPACGRINRYSIIGNTVNTATELAVL